MPKEPKKPWWMRLNAMLFPYLGPPPLGPYNEAPLPPTAEKACPLCGQPMGLHTFERNDDQRPTLMRCPASEAST
jgi:hypothetical protein